MPEMALNNFWLESSNYECCVFIICAGLFNGLMTMRAFAPVCMSDSEALGHPSLIDAPAAFLW